MKPWFGPRFDGYYGGVVSWEGWLAVLVFVAGLFALRHYLGPQGLDIRGVWKGAALGMWILAFLGLRWLKYDPDV